MKNWIILIISLSFNFVNAQIELQDFNQKFDQNPKPIFIYFNSDWCSICKIQEKEIEKNQRILSELNYEFYYLKLNAETDDNIKFLKKTFSPNKGTKIHSFITEFVATKDVAYPLWIILDKNLEVLGKFSGLIKKKNFEQLFSQIKKE